MFIVYVASSALTPSFFVFVWDMHFGDLPLGKNIIVDLK